MGTGYVDRQAIQGKWCLLLQGEPNPIEGRALLACRDGMLIDGGGIISPADLERDTLTARLERNVMRTVNRPAWKRAPAGQPARTDGANSCDCHHVFRWR